MRRLGWLVALATWVTSAWSQPGAIDTSFRAELRPEEIPRAIAARADGSVYVLMNDMASERHRLPLVVRFLSDGTRDAGFRADAATDSTGYSFRGLQVDGEGRVYLAGARNRDDKADRRGPLARLNADGRPDPEFGKADEFDRILHSYHVRADGKVWAVGRRAGRSGMSLVLLDSAGNRLQDGLDAPEGTWFNVNSVIHRPGRGLLLAGQIEWPELSAHSGLIQFGTDGKPDPSFHPDSTMVDGSPFFNISQARVLKDDRILICGLFTGVGKHATTNVARLLPDGRADDTFQCPTIDGSVDRLWIDTDGSVLIADGFEKVAGFARQGLARLNPDGSLDTGYAAQIPARASIEAADMAEGGRMVVGGLVRGDSGQRRFLVRLQSGIAEARRAEIVRQPEGIRARVGGNHFMNPVVRCAPSSTFQWFRNGEAIPGGTNVFLPFPRLRMEHNGSYILRVRSGAETLPTSPVWAVVEPALASAGSPDLAVDFQGGPNGPVQALLPLPGGGMMVGGDFSTFGGRPMGGLVVLDENGGLDLERSRRSWTRGEVRFLQSDGDGFLVGGRFGRIGSFTYPCLARLRADGSVDPEFVSGLRSFSRVESAARLADGSVLVSGFLVYGEDPETDWVGIARLDGRGQMDRTFEERLAAPVQQYRVATLADGSVCMTGSERRSWGKGWIQFLLPTGEVDTRHPSIPWTALPPRGVNGMLPIGGSRVFVYGGLGFERGAEGPKVVGAPVGPAGGTTKGWLRRTALLLNGGKIDDSGPFSTAEVNFPEVHCMTRDREGRVLLGDQRIRRLTENGLDPSFLATLDGRALALAVDERGSIYVGGNFRTAGGAVLPNLARLYGEDRSQPYLMGPFKSEKGLELRLETQEGWEYELETAESAEPASWTSAATFQGDGKLQVLEGGQSDSPARFFRIRVRR